MNQNHSLKDLIEDLERKIEEDYDKIKIDNGHYLYIPKERCFDLKVEAENKENKAINITYIKPLDIFDSLKFQYVVSSYLFLLEKSKNDELTTIEVSAIIEKESSEKQKGISLMNKINSFIFPPYSAIMNKIIDKYIKRTKKEIKEKKGKLSYLIKQDLKGIINDYFKEEEIPKLIKKQNELIIQEVIPYCLDIKYLEMVKKENYKSAIAGSGVYTGIALAYLSKFIFD
ncbi:MAG: hypothetical protein ABGW69_03925 [Nanoarchaeota archaeon]